MKIFKLSDDDYLSLLQALTDSAEAHEYVRDQCTEAAHEHYQEIVDEAVRLHALLKPLTKPEIKAELNQERFSMITQAMWLLTKAGIDVPITRDGKVLHVAKGDPIWKTDYLAEFED